MQLRRTHAAAAAVFLIIIAASAGSILFGPKKEFSNLHELYSTLVKEHMIDDTFAVPVFDAAFEVAAGTRLATNGINVNRQPLQDSLNIYLISRPERLPQLRAVACNCLAFPAKNLIACDSAFVEDIAYSFAHRPREQRTERTEELREVMLAADNGRSSAILAWAIAHEIGHIYLRHDQMYAGYVELLSGNEQSSLLGRMKQWLTSAWHQRGAGFGLFTPVQRATIPLRDLESDADTFVVENVTRARLGEMFISLQNFSGLLDRLAGRYAAEQRNGEPWQVRYHPDFHPDLAYRALLMARQAVGHPSMPQSGTAAYYDELLARYRLVEAPLDAGKFCQIPRGLRETEYRRDDIEEDEKRAMQALAILSFDLASDIEGSDYIERAITVLGGRQALRNKSFPAHFYPVAVWIAAVDVYVSRLSAAEAEEKYGTLFSAAFQQYPRVRDIFSPAYIRLARSALAMRERGEVIASDNAIFKMFSQVPDSNIVEQIERIVRSNLRVTTRDSAFTRRVTAFEAVDIARHSAGGSTFQSRFADLIWPVSHWLATQGAESDSRFVVPHVVHTSVLGTGFPTAFVQSVLTYAGDVATWDINRRTEEQLDWPNLELLGATASAAVSRRASKLAVAALTAGQAQCLKIGIAGCSIPTWVEGEIQVLLLLGHVREAIAATQKALAVFWQVADKSEGRLVEEIQNRVRNVDLAREWLAILRSAPIDQIQNRPFRVRLFCMTAGIEAALGMREESLTASDRCADHTKQLAPDGCVVDVEVANSQWSDCFAMHATLSEVYMLNGRYAQALASLNTAERYYERRSGRPFKTEGRGFLLDGEEISWDAYREKVARVAVRDQGGKE